MTCLFCASPDGALILLFSVPFVDVFTAVSESTYISDVAVNDSSVVFNLCIKLKYIVENSDTQDR